MQSKNEGPGKSWGTLETNGEGKAGEERGTLVNYGAVEAKNRKCIKKQSTCSAPSHSRESGG